MAHRDDATDQRPDGRTWSAELPDGAIARIWHGRTPAAKADEYLRLTRTVALPDYRRTPGNLGAFVLARRDTDTAPPPHAQTRE